MHELKLHKWQQKNKKTTTGVLISEQNKICTQLENTHNLRGRDVNFELFNNGNLLPLSLQRSLGVRSMCERWG